VSIYDGQFKIKLCLKLLRSPDGLVDIVFLTHTHWFSCFIGTIRHNTVILIFILYKLYILSPNPKPANHRTLSVLLHFQKTLHSMNYKLFSSWGPKHFLTRTRIFNIAIFAGTFCPYNVWFTLATHTHTPSSFIPPSESHHSSSVSE